MNFLGFGQSAEIDIVFDGAENRKQAEVKGEDGKIEKLFLYYDGETVSGKVNVTLKKPGSKLEHQGIKIEFIGQIELYYDRGNHHEFKSLAKALARPGDLLQNNSYPFEFPNVEKPYEVYVGSNVRLRYFLRVTIGRRLSDITKEVDIAVHTLSSYPEMNNPIKMEVGIEDCLHIEFEYNKCKYHLSDTIIGKIYFLLVRIKIKHMEIAIIKKECTGTGPNMFTENETIAKYEIMDGAPVKGESIPIRVFLAGYNLTPTMRDINKKFSVKYFLNLVLMDTEDRRYFKQQEITLWRKADLPRYHGHNQQIQSGSQMPSLNQHHPAHAPAHLVGAPASAVKKMAAAAAAAGLPPPGELTNNEEPIMEKPPLESKMGLFTRESPNQEFSQHADDSMPTSPTYPTMPNINTIVNERGMADGAAAASNSPVFMWATTPPPLKQNDLNEPPNNQPPSSTISDNIQEDEDDLVHHNKENDNDDNEENGLTNVSLRTNDESPSSSPTPAIAEPTVATSTSAVKVSSSPTSSRKSKESEVEATNDSEEKRLLAD